LPLASVWVTFSNGQNSYTYLFGQTVQVRRHKRERMQENDKRAGLDHN
jgi:lipocalin